MGEWTKERHEACKARHAAASDNLAYYCADRGGEILSWSSSGDSCHHVADISEDNDGLFFTETCRDIPDMLAEIERLRTMVRARGELDLDFWTDVFAETGEELDGKAVRFASKRRPKQALNLIGDAIKGARGRAKK